MGHPTPGIYLRTHEGRNSRSCRYQIGPVDVENALAEHPEVAESAVVSTLDHIQGEVIKVFIILAPQFLSHDQNQLTMELQQHVKGVTVLYKYPRKLFDNCFSGPDQKLTKAFLFLGIVILAIVFVCTVLSVEYIFGYFPKDLIHIIHQYTKEDLGFLSNLVDILPDNFHPRPDFYGLHWKPVLIATYLGIALLAIFIWHTIFAVKPPVYQVSLEQISKKIKNYRKENTELLEKISIYEQKISESKKSVQETERGNKIFSDEARKFKILEQEKSIKKLKYLISINVSELSKVQAALEETRVSEGKLKTELEWVQEDNAQLQTKKEQLEQKIVRCQKEHAEFSELIRALEMFEKDLTGALTQRANDIDALNDCISQLNWLSKLKPEGQNPDINESENGKLTGDQNRRMRDQKIQMMDVSWAKTAVSAAEEDLKLLQFKLRALMSNKCNLEAYKKELEVDCNSLTVRKAAKEAECQILRMKLKILDEIYEQRKKVTEEKLRLNQRERQESQRQLSAVEVQGKLAAEEVGSYEKRIKEMEKQLQQVERSFQHQITLHEVKAHENWVRARSLERKMIEATKETAYLKQRYTLARQELPFRPGDWVLLCAWEDEPHTQLKSAPALDPNPTTTTLQDNWNYPGPGAAPMRNSSSGSWFPAEEVEESKVHRAIRKPPPFPGPPFRHCLIRCLPFPLVGYGPPPLPWSSPGPQPEPPPPPPFGGETPEAGSVEAV